MAALLNIVPQRTDYDCVPAALATVMGWSYEHAREVLGSHTYARGTFFLPLTTALLPHGLAGSYILSRSHPLFAGATDSSHWRDMLASPAEIREQIRGRRAILAVPGKSPEGHRGPEYGHAIAWDGERAIHCGCTEPDPEPAREIALDGDLPFEALILTEVPIAAPEPAKAIPGAIEGGTSLAALFERHERVVLGFSGGKESIALAHMLEPWRDQVTLAWTNTGWMARHMVEFVRGYRDRGWILEELSAPNLLDVWAINGTPVDVAPVANMNGTAEPRLQPWLNCCFTTRQQPMNAYLRTQAPCAYVVGQRANDFSGATMAGLRSNLPASVEVALPLTDWTEADVYAYIDRHGLELPPQYAEGYPDSIECVVCPAQIYSKRMDYLARRYPEVLPGIRSAVMQAFGETAKTMGNMLTTVQAEYPQEPTI